MFALHWRHFSALCHFVCFCRNVCIRVSRLGHIQLPAHCQTGIGHLEHCKRFLCWAFSFDNDIKNLKKTNEKRCSHCTSIWEKWGEITCQEMKVKKISINFKLKCWHCRCWRHFWWKTVPGFCHRNTKCSVADCSETCLWYGKIH